MIDHPGRIKIITLEKPDDFDQKEILVVKEKYFVDKNFIGGIPYTLSDSMLYTGFSGYLLQNVQQVNENATSVYDFTPPEGLVSSEIPLISESTIVLIGVNNNRNNGLKGSTRVASLMPLFNYPKFSILSEKKRRTIRNEFFFKLPNSETELVVYQLQSEEKNYVEFSFYRTNGKYVNSIKLQVPGVKDYLNFEIKLSPNGKLLFYK